MLISSDGTCGNQRHVGSIERASMASAWHRPKELSYEQALRSPLLIRTPGLADPGRASQVLVETVDIYPTLAELCKLPAPADLDGRSLRDALSDPAAPTAKPAHGFWTGGQRTVRTDRWRLIAHPAKDATSPVVELFDYETDPDETRNQAGAHPEVVAELLAKLKPAFQSKQPK